MTDLRFKPAGKRVLVQALGQTPRVGSVIIPDRYKESQPAEAIIVSIGPKVPTSFEGKVGDRVFTNRFSGTDVKIRDQDYRLLEPADVLAVIEHA